jgi:long-chain acyl-CoA synthetase
VGPVPEGRMAEDTFPKLLLRNAQRFADRPAMREKDLGIWQVWTWAQMRDEIAAFSIGLSTLGFARGDKVAIVGANRPQLYWTFCAVQSLGGVPVPVYKDAVAEEMAFVLNHAEVRFAVVEDQEQVDKLLSLSDRLPKLDHVIYEDDRGLADYDHSRLHGFATVQQRGRDAIKADPGAVERWEQEVGAGKGDDISVILYTSGTTGQSKGVMLSAERCIAAARDTVAFDKLTEKDEALAYLPLAWVGDHYLNFAQAMVAGFCVSCPENEATVLQDLREIGPSFYFAPPPIFESLLTTVTIRMEDAGRVKRWAFHYFLDVARRVGEDILNHRSVALKDRLLYAIGRWVVYEPLKNVLGFSRIRVAYTAGEAIGPELFTFYRSLGMNLKQLYGQTEAFLYLTAHRDGEIRADTVGPPMPNVDLKITEAGEVLFKSPGMFVGYFRDNERTAETLTPDGYVKTGDAGFFDTEGHLRIIDRAKDVGRLNDGTLFAPKYIENKLKFFPNIREVVAFGHQRDFVAVFINIDLNAIGNWAERKNIAYGSYQELAAHRDVYAMIESHVSETNRDLASEPKMAGAQIHRFLILHKELDPDDGELTRTLKVRRGFIAERYGPLIEALYDGSTSQYIETEVTFEDGRKGMIHADVEIRDVKTYPVREHKEAAE